MNFRRSVNVEDIVRNNRYKGVVRPCVGPCAETGIVGFVKHGLVFDPADPKKVIGYEGGDVDGCVGYRSAWAIDENGIDRMIGWIDYEVVQDKSD